MILFRNLLISLMVSLLLLGCATMSNNDPTTNTNRDELVGQGTIGGAILGAFTGYLTCDKEDKEKCAAAGALIGGIGGFVLADEVAKRKSKYANWEDRITEQTRSLTQLTTKIRADNHNLSEQIRSNKKKIVWLKSVKNRNQAQVVQLKNLRSEVTSSRTRLQNTLNGLTNELRVQQQLQRDYEQETKNSKPGKLRIWRTRTADLQKEINILQKLNSELINMEQTI